MVILLIMVFTPLRGNLGLGFIQDGLDLLAVRLALSLDLREGGKEPLLDLEEGLRLTVRAILVDGPLADESEVLFLRLGAAEFNIGANGFQRQVREIIAVSLGLDLDSLEGGVVAACGLQVLVGVGTIFHGVVHFGAGEFDGAAIKVNSHGIYLSGVGRHPLFFFLFGSEVCFVFLISYVYIVADWFLSGVTLLVQHWLCTPTSGFHLYGKYHTDFLADLLIGCWIIIEARMVKSEFLYTSV